jgi:hypothetical protein
MTKVTSATIAVWNLNSKLDALSSAVDDDTVSFKEFKSRLEMIKEEAAIEADRLLYLNEFRKYTGHRITSFLDLKNQ